MAAIIEPAKIGALLRSIEVYRGEAPTRLALKLIPYIFPRPGELRTMEWAHVRLRGVLPEWRVPWRRMKMREPHIVPLSRQAAEILREVQRLTAMGAGSSLNCAIRTGRCPSVVSPRPCARWDTLARR